MVSETQLPIVAIDLFCGAGGLSYGMQRSGITISAGIDVDPACRHPFEANTGAKFHEMDAQEITPKFLKSLFPSGVSRVLSGCAPCQPFSSYARSAKRDRWKLVSKFGELVDGVRPEIVTMENVPGLSKYQVFDKYVKILKRAGYHYKHGTVDCAEYGIPQTRKRLVLLASKLGPIEMPPAPNIDKHVTVRDTIYRLGPIAAGAASPHDRLHRSSGLSPKNIKRIKSSKPGGSWKSWDSKLRTACHTRSTGKSYVAVYGRMEWDKPAPTITTQFHGFGSGRFGHPEQHRAISLREGALLQTFPPRYSFVPDGEDITIKTVARMIGNAVPVRLGEVIGQCIVSHVRKHG